MDTVNIKINDFKNAPNGTLLIKKDNRWQPITFDELNQKNNDRLTELEKLPNQFDLLAKNNKHFIKYAKSHFLVVFNAFKLKVIVGEISIDDESIMSLDDDVISGKINVQEAIKKHDYLNKTFNAVYLNSNDLITFPEV